MARLDEVVQEQSRPVLLAAHSLGCHLVAAWAAHSQHTSRVVGALLVAHSLGCHLVAAWAGHSRHTARVAGALLVAPPDVARADLPPQVQTWAPIHRQPLPFASTAVLSADDPFGDAAHGLQLAAAWGSEIGSLGAAGHINADSGLRDWPDGIALLRALATRAGLTLDAAAG